MNKPNVNRGIFDTLIVKKWNYKHIVRETVYLQSIGA